jgi:predicted lipoprotein with Yx(FWY)xxD motif
MRLSIKNPLTAFVAVGLAALVLAACGNSNDDDGTATAAGAGSDIVSVKNVDGTDVLADSRGKTLYTADVENSGQIMCTGSCTSIWEPATATAKEAKSASSQLDVKLDTVKRADGGDQLALQGIPLYSFTEEGAGELDGNGLADDFNGTHFVWTAATTSAWSTTSAPSSSSPY